MARIALKKDKYRRARGGTSKLLDISCAYCGSHICLYQKDGPGILMRMYLDRIYESEYAGLQSTPLKNLPQLICANCKRLMGVPYIYEEERRLAFRLIVGAVSKRIVK